MRGWLLGQPYIVYIPGHNSNVIWRVHEANKSHGRLFCLMLDGGLGIMYSYLQKQFIFDTTPPQCWLRDPPQFTPSPLQPIIITIIVAYTHHSWIIRHFNVNSTFNLCLNILLCVEQSKQFVSNGMCEQDRHIWLGRGGSTTNSGTAPNGPANVYGQIMSARITVCDSCCSFRETAAVHRRQL